MNRVLTVLAVGGLAVGGLTVTTRFANANPAPGADHVSTGQPPLNAPEDITLPGDSTAPSTATSSSPR